MDETKVKMNHKLFEKKVVNMRNKKWKCLCQ